MILRKLLEALKLKKAIAKPPKRRITKLEGIRTMLESNKYAEIAKQPILVAGLLSVVGATALKLDRHFGSRDITEETSPDPEFLADIKPGADKTLIFLGGLCMNNEEVAERYKSQLAADTNLIAPIFPDSGFDPKTIFEKTYQKVAETNPKEILVAGLSMGGLLGWDWLQYGVETGRQDIVESVSRFAVRGTPIGANAIRMAPRMLLSTASRLGYSYTLNRGRNLLNKNPNCTSLVEAKPTKVIPQCRYLAGNHAQTLPITPERLIYIRGTQPDPIVHETAAVRAWARKAKTPIIQVVDTDSIETVHAPTDKKSIHFMLQQLGIAKSQDEPIPHMLTMLPQAA